MKVRCCRSLHALQDEFGYIDEAAEPLIAAALNRSRAEIHGVFTFYHDFRHVPPGRHVLKLCRAEACQAAGGDALAARAEARLGIALGETTAADGSVTLEPIYCLGLCATAPSAMIDGRLVGRLDPDGASTPASGGSAMTLRVFIPGDAGAVAVGADEVADALRAAAVTRGISRSRSCAPARADFIGWSRWSRSAMPARLCVWSGRAGRMPQACSMRH